MENTNDKWFLVDVTHPSFNAMRASAATRHAQFAGGAALSVYLNNAGTEALVKVRTGGNWTPAWESAPFVLRTFTPSDHNEAQDMIYTPEWERVEE